MRFFQIIIFCFFGLYAHLTYSTEAEKITQLSCESGSELKMDTSSKTAWCEKNEKGFISRKPIPSKTSSWSSSESCHNITRDMCKAKCPQGYTFLSESGRGTCIGKNHQHTPAPSCYSPQNGKLYVRPFTTSTPVSASASAVAQKEHSKISNDTQEVMNNPNMDACEISAGQWIPAQCRDGYTKEIKTGEDVCIGKEICLLHLEIRPAAQAEGAIKADKQIKCIENFALLTGKFQGVEYFECRKEIMEPKASPVVTSIKNK